MTEEERLERNRKLQKAFDFEYNKYGELTGKLVPVDKFAPDVRKWTFGVKVPYEDIADNPTKVEDYVSDLGSFCAGFIAGSLGTNTHVGARCPWTVEAADEDDSVVVRVRGRFKFYTPESEKE